MAIGIVSLSAAHEHHPAEGHLVAGEQVAIIVIGVDALQLESAAPVIVVGAGEAVVAVVVGVGDVTREDPFVLVVLEEVDADHVATLVIIKRVDEVVNLAASVGNGMARFQQVVGVVKELHPVDVIIGMEAIEDVVLRQGCAAREQGDKGEEEVFEVLHDARDFELEKRLMLGHWLSTLSTKVFGVKTEINGSDVFKKSLILMVIR